MKLKQEQLSEFLITVLDSRPELKERPPGGFAQISVPSLVESWTNMMDLGSGVAYGSVSDVGKPIGFLLGFHSIDPMTGVRTGFEFLWVTSPKSAGRPRGVGTALLKEFEEGAKLDGCEQIVIGCNQIFRPDMLAEWYGWMGFQPCSQSFQKWIN
jgi:hypothetical protein